MVRVRAIGVLPDGKSSLYIAENPALSSPRSSLSMSDTVIPEVDISYFFTKNIAVELDLGVPPRSSITGTGLLAGLPVGKASALPPTLTFQYHFTDLGAFKPYVGLGVNYTTFFNVRAANDPTIVPGTANLEVLSPLGAIPTAGAVSLTHLSISDSFGAVAQVGFDYMLDRHWGVNFDVKKVWMRPEYSATAVVTGTGLLNGVGLGVNHITGTAHIDPWIVGGGVTYKF